MRPRFLKVWDYLRSISKTSKHPRPGRRTARPTLEMLEDRCLLSVSGSISGLVFLNSHVNPLNGATISLTGTPTATPTIPVNLTSVTDGNGAFTFSGLPAGSYHLSAGPFAGLMGTATIDGVTTSTGVTLDTPVAVTSGPTAAQDIVVHGGIAPEFINMGLFLTTTTRADLPFGTPGAGAPNNTPTVTTAIAAQALSASRTSAVIDLAGHFGDPAISNSSVTMNITANGVTKDLDLNLFDTTAPQTVANFYDYVNSSAYDKSFFHRETNIATDGIAVLQGGGATITNGTGPSVIIPVLAPIPDEIGASNLKGTLAMANTGAANTATDQFFFNTADNTGLNPKFTVFAKVADADSQAVLDNLGATPVQNLSSQTAAITATGATESGNTVTMTTAAAHGFTVGQSVVIANVGVAGYNGTFTILSAPTATTFTYTDPMAGLLPSGSGTAAAPAFAKNSPSLLLNEVPLNSTPVTDFPTASSKYLVINSITTTKRDDFLTYSIVSNSTPSVASATLTNEQLTLTKIAAGTTTITVQATDRFGATVTQTFNVTVS
jgi:cyclophilin family peptidyl-prolyl cis-trans isomerase